MKQFAPHDLTVRKVPFEFPDTIDPVWHPAEPEFGHMVSGASVTMPYLEPFLIRTMREGLKQVDEPGLIQDCQGFMAQEGQHFQNHRKFNDLLKKKAYPGLEQYEKAMGADFVRYNQTKSLKWRLAYTAGFETMSIGLTHWLVEERGELFQGADPIVTSLVLWHMIEEIEHKTVAIDLYRYLYPRSYFMRLYGIFFASLHIMRYSKLSYREMLKVDGRWTDKKSRKRLIKMVRRFFLGIGPIMLKGMLPGHHPSHIKDPDWVDEWKAAYQAMGEDAVPLLDTQDPEIPAQFAV